MQNNVQKYDTFTTKISVLKNYMLCTSGGKIINIENTIIFLMTRIDEFLKNEKNSKIMINFFHFFLNFEFLIQVICSDVSSIVDDHVTVEMLCKLVSMALILKQKIYEEVCNDDFDRKNDFNESDCNSCGNNCNNGSINCHLNDEIDNTSRYNNENDTNDNQSQINIQENNNHKNEVTTTTDQKKLQNLNELIFKILVNGIGYVLIEIFFSQENLNLLLKLQNRDILHSISTFFDCNEIPFNTKTSDMKSTIHPVILILMNIFFIPKINSDNIDEKVLIKICELNKNGYLNPKKDFSVLKLSSFLCNLPVFKSNFDRIYNSNHHINKHKIENIRIIPEISNLNKKEFSKLTNILIIRFKKRLEMNDIIDSDMNMDISFLSSDIVMHVFSFMTFKRICRMACVSSGIYIYT
jgi:hypothetical protein